eukprot:g39576.t1
MDPAQKGRGFSSTETVKILVKTSTIMPQEEETRKTESPNKAPEEEKSNEQDAEEEEGGGGRGQHQHHQNYQIQGQMSRVSRRTVHDVKDKREDRLPKKGSVHPLDDTVVDEQIMHVMRALMGQRADSDGKPVWKGRTDYLSDVQRLTVAVLQGEFGSTLKGARDVISIRLGKLKARKSKPYSNKEHIGQYKIVKGATVQPGQSDDERIRTTEEGQEQVDLTIVSTSASLSAVPKKGMGVLLESPRKGEDGIEEVKKGEWGSDSNKRKKVLLESPSKNEDGTEEAKGKELRGVVLKHFPTVDVALVSLDENVPGMVGREGVLVGLD